MNRVHYRTKTNLSENFKEILSYLFMIFIIIWRRIRKKIQNFTISFWNLARSVWPNLCFRNGNKMFERLDYLYTGRQDSHCTQTSRFQTYRPAYISVYIIRFILISINLQSTHMYYLCVFYIDKVCFIYGISLCICDSPLFLYLW